MKTFRITTLCLTAIMVCVSAGTALAAINDPSDVPDLVLHLEANDLGFTNGQPVTNWTDSVNGNIFTPQQGFGDSILVADGAKAFRPKVLYPYHYGDTDTSKIVELLKAEKDIEVRIRSLK